MTLTGREQVSLYSIDMYKSYQNINKEHYNNADFSYRWVDGSVHNVTLVNGGYDSIDTINNFLMSKMNDNKHYLYDTVNKNKIFYILLQENAVAYRCMLNINPVPSVMPSGCVIEGNWVLPANPTTPQIIFNNTSLFHTVVGFNKNQTYPPAPQTSLYQVLGESVPIITNISSLLVKCNICLSNSGGVINNLLYAFSPSGVPYGGLINSSPNHELLVPSVSSMFDTIELTIVDQNYQPVELLDSQVLIVIILR